MTVFEIFVLQVQPVSELVELGNRVNSKRMLQVFYFHFL